jgi:hypothetical protein
MKRALTAAFLLSLALTPSSFGADAVKARDYAGAWLYDAAASKDMPPQFADIEQWALNVTQTADHLNVHVQIKSKRPERPSMDQTLNYALDGTETTAKTQVMTPDGPAQVPTFLTAHVAAGGNLDISIARELPMGDEGRRFTTTEKWELAADGKTLTVHRHDQRPQGGTADFDVVFRKSA